jgi:hypothetical protein
MNRRDGHFALFRTPSGPAGKFDELVDLRVDAPFE